MSVGAALALAPAAAAEPYPYGFPDETREVAGARGPGGAPVLDAGETYRSTIGPGQELHYRVRLDDASSAYVSAVALPGLGDRVAFGDGLALRLENAEGGRCGTARTGFGNADFPRPLVASVERLVAQGALHCRAAGTYTLIVARTDGGRSASRETWDLELDLVNEPALEGVAPSETPSPRPEDGGPLPEGAAEERQGGTSFHDAVAIGTGVWRGRIEPGRTLFYKVPVDWGQRIAAGAELRAPGDEAVVAQALRLGLHNPAHDEVAADQPSLRGTRVSAALDGLPPVAYENRLASAPRVKGMRFAGAYYLQLTLSPDLAERYGEGPLDVTLRVGVDGAAVAGPSYVGDPGIFDAEAVDAGTDADAGTDGSEGADEGEGADRDADGQAADGTGPAAGHDGGMQLVAAVSIALGTALVLWLAVWAVVGRRHRES